MVVPDGDVDVLAQDMIKHFPADAADRAALRAKVFFVLGYGEMSKKWLLVHGKIATRLASQTIDPGPASSQAGEGIR